MPYYEQEMNANSLKNLNFSVHNVFNQIYPFCFYSGIYDSYTTILGNHIYFNHFNISFFFFFRLRKNS